MLLLLAGLALLAGWLCRPVVHYDGYSPAYDAVAGTGSGSPGGEAGPAGVIGKVKVSQFETSWKAARNLSLNCRPFYGNAHREHWQGWWSKHGGSELPGSLFFRHHNLVWSIEPPDEIAGFPRGSDGWIKQVEDLGKRISDEFETGILKSDQIEETRKRRFEVLILEPVKEWRKSTGKK